MIEDKRNFYIDLIEFGLERGYKGIDRNEIYDFLAKNGYISDESAKRIQENILSIEDSDTENTVHLLLHSVFEHRNSRYFLNFEGVFKWLEYKELMEARNNSKDAKRHSFIAIIISVIALLVSIVFGVYENWQAASVQKVIDTTMRIEISSFSCNE